MALWVVRAGDEGQQEEGVLKNNVIAHGWNGLGDLSKFHNFDLFYKYFKQVHPREEHGKPTDYEKSSRLRAGEVWAFQNEIQIGDLVLLPSKKSKEVFIGKVLSDYEYKEYADNIKHTRKVKWLKTINSSEIPEKIRNSMGTGLTVFNIEKNDAENFIKNSLQQNKQYFLIQVTKFGSADILTKGIYQHEGWEETPRDADHGKVKVGDLLIIYFGYNAIDYKKTLKMIYQVESITNNNVKFYVKPLHNLNGVTREKINDAVKRK